MVCGLGYSLHMALVKDRIWVKGILSFCVWVIARVRVKVYY